MNRFCRALLLVAGVVGLPGVSAAQGGEKTLKLTLGYSPDPVRLVAVVPVKGGPYADSLLAIVQRDLKYSNRVTTMALDNRNPAVFYDAFRSISYDFFRGVNANHVVEMTASQAKVTVRVHDVNARKPLATADFALPSSGLSRDWRLAVHHVSDSLVAILTEGPRGIAATRLTYVRGSTLRMIDSDGEFDIAIPADSNAGSAAWDPTGRRLVYSTHGTDSRVIMMDLPSYRPHIVQKKVWNTTMTTPVFSPDGNSVLYSRLEDDGYSSLWRVPLGGGDPYRIDRNRGISSSPSFSPDGRRITFMTDRLGHNEVYIMDADGANSVWITQIAGDRNESNYRAEPDWSPDGVRIAYQSRTSGSFQIMIVNLQENSATLVTSSGENQSPSWAPDGRHLVFTSNRSGVDQLWILDTRSGDMRQLTKSPGARFASWSPRLTPQ